MIPEDEVLQTFTCQDYIIVRKADKIKVYLLTNKKQERNVEFFMEYRMLDKTYDDQLTYLKFLGKKNLFDD